jgi:YkoY family integral membrane protein
MVENFLAILTLVLMEGLLSADNALVLAILVQRLPKYQQKKALFYGLAGAFILRFIGLALAVYLVKFWYLKALGGIYLAYLCISHFYVKHQSNTREIKIKHPGFWHTVAVVEFTDLAFAIDSILVAVAVSRNLWVIYTGGMLGIIAMRIAAGYVIKLLEKYPDLEHLAYVLIGWISLKLGFESMEHFMDPVVQQSAAHYIPIVFWIGMAVIVCIGLIHTAKQRRLEKTDTKVSKEES